ncbi:MAG: DUF2330 domain-containing protein [Kofleriaceae bacterium]
MSTTVPAHAFCGFYVSGSDAKMFNDATNVVLMREGTRTVLSMQNDYKGPLEDFAMVVPVPVVLKPTDVRVIPKDVLDRIDKLGSPRLVEYWEQDPCPMPYEGESYGYATMATSSGPGSPPPSEPRPKPRRAMDRSGDDALDQRRRAVPPILASFAASPTTVTSGVPTKVQWTWSYSNQPWPEPSCTVDHGVGSLYNGAQAALTLADSSMITLTCANSAGRSTKQVKINAVKIEAKFDVAEYQILILSAAEATGLEEWLRINKYKIPKDAEALLRPYVENGSKFFVAKVDPKKVKMVDGRGVLSPLRFHYDSEEFALPIRLGMANSSGKQDLIINILSSKRFEVANYKNVVIPTNFDVKPSVKNRFTEFYTALFDKTIEANRGAVVTEYAWDTQPSIKCDPCPPQVPTDADALTLGADVIGGRLAQGYYTLTRLHARYGKDDMKDDLRFREAKPIVGGREMWSRQGLEYGATPAAQNNFQARYAIRHWWTGPMKCKNPTRGVWGGPPHGGHSQVIASEKTAFAPRGKLELASVIRRDLWEIGYKKQRATPAPATKSAPGTKTMAFGGGVFGALALFGLFAIARRRRR